MLDCTLGYLDVGSGILYYHGAVGGLYRDGKTRGRFYFIEHIRPAMCQSYLVVDFSLMLTLLKGIIPALIIVRVGPGLMADHPQVNILPSGFDQSQLGKMDKFEIQQYEVYHPQVDYWI
jgi:hypothetical protein